MNIYNNTSKFPNDKFIQVFVCWDFENNAGYDVYETYTDYSKIPNYEESKYLDFFELIANKVPDLEKAEHIAKVFAHNNGLVYAGDVSP